MDKALTQIIRNPRLKRDQASYPREQGQFRQKWLKFIENSLFLNVYLVVRINNPDDSDSYRSLIQS